MVVNEQQTYSPYPWTFIGELHTLAEAYSIRWRREQSRGYGKIRVACCMSCFSLAFVFGSPEGHISPPCFYVVVGPTVRTAACDTVVFCERPLSRVFVLTSSVCAAR